MNFVIVGHDEGVWSLAPAVVFKGMKNNCSTNSASVGGESPEIGLPSLVLPNWPWASACVALPADEASAVAGEKWPQVQLFQE